MPGGSVSRAMRVIELLVEEAPRTLSELSRAAKVPVSSARRILGELEASGYVRRTGKEYDLTYKLLTLSGRLLGRIRLADIARPYLERLAAEFQDTVFLALYRKDHLVYIDKRITSMSLHLDVEIGVSRPLYCTGLGKAMLAYLTDREIDDYLAETKLEAYTPNTLTDPEALRAELRETRKRGYALDNEEILTGVRCVAAPILDRSGRPVAAISVAGAAPRFTPERVEAMRRRVIEATEAISRELGHTERASG